MTVTNHAKNTLNLAISIKSKVDEMRLNLENISIPDMIHLKKYTGDVIYSNLLKSTLKVSKFHSTNNKIKNKLRQEKVEIKAYQKHIKNNQGGLLAIDNEANKGEVT